MLKCPLTGPASQRGSALLIVLGLLLVISLLGALSVENSRVEINLAGNNVRRSQALWVAEAGLANAEAVLRSHPKEKNADTLMALINASSHLPNASFKVSMESGLPLRKVISIGTGIESEAGVQVMYRYGLSPYNIWNNVLFAGHGQDGMSIRGNTGIHGSVHILGNGEPYQDANGDGRWEAGEPFTDVNHDGSYDAPLEPDSVALDMTGSSLIGNNYSGLQAVLSSRMPPLATTPYAGETLQSLFSELRVLHGQVLLGGSATVGQPNAAGGSPAIKETLDGTWVNDGFGGSAATGSVFSDNGYQEKYDFEGDGPAMPDLDAPYLDKTGTAHASYMNYLKSKALVISGNLTLQYGVSVPVRSNGGGSLSLDNLGHLTASGIIYVRGDVRIIGAGPVIYNGRFTLVSEGDTKIDADFYSKGQFTVSDVAGVVSHGRLDLGDKASQLRLAGAFFAQEEVLTHKQTQVAGSLVSNYFNLTQVPNLYQVPHLTANLPPDLPGGDDVYVYSWRRVPNSWTELY